MQAGLDSRQRGEVAGEHHSQEDGSIARWMEGVQRWMGSIIARRMESIERRMGSCIRGWMGSIERSTNNIEGRTGISIEGSIANTEGWMIRNKEGRIVSIARRMASVRRELGNIIARRWKA